MWLEKMEGAAAEVLRDVLRVDVSLVRSWANIETWAGEEQLQKGKYTWRVKKKIRHSPFSKKKI